MGWSKTPSRWLSYPGCLVPLANNTLLLGVSTMTAATLGTWLAGEQLFQRRLQLIVSRNSNWRVAETQEESATLEPPSLLSPGCWRRQESGDPVLHLRDWSHSAVYPCHTDSKERFPSPSVSGKQIPSNLSQALPPFRSKPLRSLFPPSP